MDLWIPTCAGRTKEYVTYNCYEHCEEVTYPTVIHLPFE
ncbi:hypothetical protein CLOAM1014 [Candidatus Cloacimonas acidaminovorans str. Evry]|uniref:Uncharacterized protein n=1 Tax=Cloacimonas acidaminovorans (strain Evry) TaxID=459349 RepID=B0VHS1_CLOAI|nr:hypothetical protein CLOAM1014 [Candidatus Cloacimonas acidaminovorans str. Evry]